VFLVFLEIFATVLKANTKTHLVELVKERDSCKTNCIKLWKGVAPVLDLISPELPEDQPQSRRRNKRGAGFNSSSRMSESLPERTSSAWYALTTPWSICPG